MEPTFRLLRVRGIPVGAHWTWPVAFGIVTWTLARSVLPSAFPDVGSGTRLLMALAAAALLFASVVAHEVAHALVARREGMPVTGVTLWLLGGVSDAGQRARSPGQELRVAAAGPVVSLVIAGLLAVASGWAEGQGWPDAVHGVLDHAARLNLVVAAFNLIPVLPLDGGRILRAWLWRRQRDHLAATRSGARAGQAFGLTMVIVGALDLAAGAGAIGVWLVILGVFLVRAATTELGDARTRSRLEGLTAGDVMASDPGVVLDDTPVARLVDNPPAPERSGYPVLGGGRLLGVVVLASARAVPSGERAGRRVEEVMTPLDDIPMVDATVPVVDVIEHLNGTNPTGQVVVVADGCVVGILDEQDVAGALDRAPKPVPTEDPPGGRRRAGFRAWVLVGGLCLVAGAALYRPPWVVLTPGPAADVTADVTIAGVPVTPVNGRYVATTIEARRTTVLGALVAVVRDGHRVVRVDDVEAQPGLTRETRILAAAAAARSQGLPVTITGTGARVVGVDPGSPAAGVLRPGDVILAAEGTPIIQAGPLAEIVRRQPPGTGLRLSVERDGEAREVVVTARDGEIGITVETRDLAVGLPFEVRFAGAIAGGPDAGLAYALAITDMLSTLDLAQGRTVAAAGRIVDADGRVGPTGDAATRAEAAAEAGAVVLVVPQGDAEGAGRDGLHVEGVDSLARAVEALSTTV